MEHVSLREVSGMISIGRDSIVFPCPGDTDSLLKIYDNLSLSDILEYNSIHKKYGSRGTAKVSPDKRFVEYAQGKGWKTSFLGVEVQGSVIKVLDLSTSEVIRNNEGYTLAKIPLIKGTNLTHHLETTETEEAKFGLHMIEHMANTGLETLGIPLEKRVKGGKITRKGHNIGRDNFMITGIDADGIVEIVVTDIGFDIPEALQIERELNGQSKNSR